jgi:hypothetical protein
MNEGFMANKRLTKCRKHGVQVDLGAGEGCPDPKEPCKYRSECIIHAYTQEERAARGGEAARKPRGS